MAEHPSHSDFGRIFRDWDVWSADLMGEAKYEVDDRVSLVGVIRKKFASGLSVVEVCTESSGAVQMCAVDHEMNPKPSAIRNAALEEAIAVLDQLEEDTFNAETGAVFGMAAARIRALRSKESA